MILEIDDPQGHARQADRRPGQAGRDTAADHGTYDGMLPLCEICRSELFAEDRCFVRVK